MWVSLTQPFDSLQRARRLSKGDCVLSACLQGHKSDLSCLWTRTQTGTIPSALPDYQLAELQILGLLSYHNYVNQLFIITLSICLSFYLSSIYLSIQVLLFLWRTKTNTLSCPFGNFSIRRKTDDFSFIPKY